MSEKTEVNVLEVLDFYLRREHDFHNRDILISAKERFAELMGAAQDVAKTIGKTTDDELWRRLNHLDDALDACRSPAKDK